MNNLLDRAAFEVTADRAASVLRTALGLSDTSGFDDLLDPGEGCLSWRRADHERRLHLIADWLRSACYARADAACEMVPATRHDIPMLTVGTND